MYDLLVKDGTVVDGTGAARRTADLAIEAGRIVRIDTDISRSSARQVVEAAGKIVAPGVIDVHTHYDAQINWDPYCTNSGWHGVTTVAVGNCGFGFMPCRASDRDRYMLTMQNTEQVPLQAMRTALNWDWESFPEWLQAMRRCRKGVNLASYLPLNSLMIYVMGYEAAKTRGATAAERQQMRDLLNEAMDAGAIGFSLSHLNEQNTHKDVDGSPMVTDQMQIEDAYYLAEVLRERDQGIIQALVEVPSGSNRHVAEEFARISRRPILHNIIQGFSTRPDYHKSILAWLERCEKEGLQIYSQALQMRAWLEFNVLDNTAWAHVPPFTELVLAGSEGGYAAQARLAQDPGYRARAREQYDPIALAGTGGALDTFFFKDAHGAERWRKHEGKLLSDIAVEEHIRPVDLFLDIIADTGAKADFKTTDLFSSDTDIIAEILTHPRVLLGTSDGGAHVKFFSGGHFATDNILHMVHDTSRMTLEDMHYKLSSLPAQVVGLNERGTLEEGKAADLYVYDYDRLGYDRSGYEIVRDLPGGDWRRTVRAKGIDNIVVNGVMTFVNSETTGAVPGQLLANTGPETDAALCSDTLMAAE